MANKPEKKKMTFTDVQIFVFFIIGGTIGFAIGIFYFNWLTGTYVVNTRKYIDQDWVKVQYYANRVVDQVIKLKKMAVADKVKFDFTIIDDAIDTRAKMIGTNKAEERIKNLAVLEPQLNRIMEYYNGRLDLKNKRFGYIEWGMITQEYINEYGEHRERFVESVLEYNNLVSKGWFKGVAKSKKLGPVPGVEENTFPEIMTNREEYYKDDGIYRMDLNEGSSSASSY